jgi:hypothetical protein
MEIDWDPAERCAQFDHRGIIIGMRDCDCLEAAEAFDEVDHCVVDQADTVLKSLPCGVRTSNARFRMRKVGAVPIPTSSPLVFLQLAAGVLRCK